MNCCLARRLSIACIFPFLTLLTACAGTPEHRYVQTPQASSNAEPGAAYLVKRGAPGQSDLSDRLQRHYREWRGTPYRFGGTTKRGIDCSGFVSVTYSDVLGVRTPRTTALLLRGGKQIPDRKRAVGDLVFFNTGGGRRHVGIYIGSDEFIHASSSKGVIASSLRSPYWSRAYRQSRRYTASAN